MVSWANGDVSHYEQFGHSIANAMAIGECRAYQDVLDLDYGVMIGELSDGQPRQPSDDDGDDDSD